MRLSVRPGILALLGGLALAQSQPDVAGILKKVSETYKAASQYEIVAERTETDPATGKRQFIHTRIAVKAPDRYRMEGVPARDRGDGGTANGIEIVLDGAAIWFYDPETKVYVSYPASALGKDLPDELAADGVDYFTMWRFREAADHAATARFLREDEIEMGGARVACDVLSLQEGGAEYTWWVDKKSSHIVREDDKESSTIFSTVRLGEELPDGLFKFDPPPGARRNTDPR